MTRRGNYQNRPRGSIAAMSRSGFDLTVRGGIANQMRFSYFPAMKHFTAFAAFLFALALPQAQAQQNPDDQYVILYSQIQQADSLQSIGQPRQALDIFVQAQA